MNAQACGPRRHPQRSLLAATGLSTLLLASAALAQSPTTVAPTSPTEFQPPSSTLPTTGTLPQPAVTVSPRIIIGRWSHTRQDAETRSSDTVTIEFTVDGRYQARNRNSLLPTPEKPSQGRYAISNLQGNSFDLRIERNLTDPGSDPRDAAEVQRITVVDANTLQAADGSVVRRIKE
jgi:hypothetical protein